MSTILIAGGSGLIGGHLSRMLRQEGHEVLHLSRRARPDAAFTTYKWNLNESYIDDEAILSADYVINLAGAGIADSPWTKARKQLIIDSRVGSARLLLSAFERLQHHPKAYISSSAVGYYGNRGDEWLQESAPPGEGFLSESCIAWEAATGKFARLGIRTAGLRTGIVLSTKGGALEKMLLPFHAWIGAYFGDGSQWYSWIHIDDICRLYIEAVENESMQGFYNGVAPNPVTNKELTKGIKEALGKSALVAPVPAFALRMAMGEMADTILDSTRVSSEKTEKAGFEFSFPNLDEALEDLLRRKV